MAEYEDFTIDQGADVAIEIHLKEQDGSNKDLTAHTITSKMKRNYNADADGTVDFTTAIGDPATNGVAILTLTNEQTDQLITTGRYVYDVEISYVDEDNNIIIERVLEGKIKVNPSVTR